MDNRIGPWLRCWERRPRASAQLVCFPHAGGGATGYRAWLPLLPPTVELIAVQYPGREDRFAEPPAEAMSQLTDPVAAALRRVLDRPYVVFGHSMGSAVGYETVLHLRRLGHPEPDRLFVSGRPAPADIAGGEVHLRDEGGLCDELARLGGTPPEVLADPDLRRAVLGYVRADYRVIETYRPAPAAPLSCPVSVFAATDDPELKPAQASGWRRVTAGRAEVRTFPGDHFYLVPERAAVVAAVVGRLDPALVRVDGWQAAP